MNKIVREHYPVEKLPADLRAELTGVTRVTVEVTQEPDAEVVPPPWTAADAVAMIRHMQQRLAAQGRSVTQEEAVRRVRELRDEWDD
jgi:hypothetical protein